MGQHIVDSEDVARILNPQWLAGRKILNMAFTLRERETYISVNRTSVPSYSDDIKNFVTSHKSFQFNNDNTNYYRALLNVGDIRGIQVNNNGTPLNVDVDVEPRDAVTKSHAGIFTRHESKILKLGNTQPIFMKYNVSVDEVIFEVRAALLKLAKLEMCSL